MSAKVSLPLRTAEIIAVGSEMLGATRLDTNSLVIAARLESLGIRLIAKSVVGDDKARIADLCRTALTRADLIILTGGLGPTDDDLTRDAVADVLGLRLIEDPSIVSGIEQRFARRGLTMPAINRRQAQVLEGARSLDNLNGTAPGQVLEHGGRVLVLLPGPPRELQPMLDALSTGMLAARAGGARIHRTSLFVTGRSESAVDEAIQPIYSTWRDQSPPIETTILAAPGQIELHLSLRAAEPAEAEAILRAARDELVAVLGDDVFSVDGRTMEQVVGDLLRVRGQTIAVAESCTGGLLLSRLTDVPGSSAYVMGGAVVYSNELKTWLAGVPPGLIAEHGAVSMPVARALADGIRAHAKADIGVGITGIAGPGGGTPQKPVGTVAIAVAAPGAAGTVRTFAFAGGRAQIKLFATQAALDMVRRVLAQNA
jgi:nicotinamide-nucleotide amidase